MFVVMKLASHEVIVSIVCCSFYVHIRPIGYKHCVSKNILVPLLTIFGILNSKEISYQKIVNSPIWAIFAFNKVVGYGNIIRVSWAIL